MPTVARIRGYRLYFYSHEPDEPPHVHVDHSGRSAKVWLEPVSIAINRGFRPHELNAILRLVQQNRQQALETWDAHFGD